MKKLISITAGLFAALTISAQCPQISCPSNITVNNDPGTCGAVVNYATPVGTNPCGSSTQTFNYTGSMQTFTVPAGITLLTIETWGAQGGTNTNDSINCIIGGKGGYSKGDLVVTPGQILNIYVGGKGHAGNVGGWNGGGVACSQTTTCAKGGGASDVRISPYALTDRVIVGAGGGGAEWSGCSGSAGNGGGLIGADGAHPVTGPRDGKGGTQVAGGAAGLGGYNGTAGLFGIGGDAGTHPAGHAGSGGGGWYGGGGSAEDGHAGGGSSYIGGVTNASTTAGLKSGNGEVIISWTGGPATTTQTSGLPDGGTFPVGVTTNWYKVEDGLGNKDSCSFTVTVVDNEAPSISCPSDTTICWGIYNATIATSDNCPNETVAQIAGPTLGSSFDVGTYTLEFVVTDASGNKDTCNYNVTVEVCGGVNENNSKYGISVYPNPMKEYVIIENKNIEGSYTIEITNTLGAIVKTVTSNLKRLEIAKGEMSKGMYYYSIKQNNQTLSSGKLAVE
jgi:hypothetical protein